MEGRWNVLPGSERNGTWIALDPDKNLGVPVVPCDDAAVERAADVVNEFMNSSYTWSVTELAEAVLRAAGETTGRASFLPQPRH